MPQIRITKAEQIFANTSFTGYISTCKDCSLKIFIHNLKFKDTERPEFNLANAQELIEMQVLDIMLEEAERKPTVSTSPRARVQTSASTDASEASTTAASGSNTKAKASQVLKFRSSVKHRVALRKLVYQKYGAGAAKKKLVKRQTEYKEAEVQQLVPPGAYIYKQQHYNRWQLTIGGTCRCRSWLQHGHFGSVQQLLQHAWKLTLQDNGFEVRDCPMANVFKPRTGNNSDDDKLIAANNLSLPL